MRNASCRRMASMGVRRRPTSFLTARRPRERTAGPTRTSDAHPSSKILQPWQFFPSFCTICYQSDPYKGESNPAENQNGTIWIKIVSYITEIPRSESHRKPDRLRSVKYQEWFLDSSPFARLASPHTSKGPAATKAAALPSPSAAPRADDASATKIGIETRSPLPPLNRLHEQSNARPQPSHEPRPEPLRGASRERGRPDSAERVRFSTTENTECSDGFAAQAWSSIGATRARHLASFLKRAFDRTRRSGKLLARWHGTTFCSLRSWAISSGGEHYLDTVGVTSSNLVSPTMKDQVIG